MSTMRSASSSTTMRTWLRLTSRLLDQVLESARAGDDDVGATPQRLALGSVTGASVEGDDPLGMRAQEAGQHFSDLLRQLAGRHQDERCWAVRAWRRWRS